ncbi:histidine kinase [Syntrophotalea acetylenivorans]|uniref:Histidine kinase n=1 Tax=Syntrophotalea acetylenivorans TaxID=1842532 RepID=A0A1L3GQW9_9BACT|nr:CBS domain-containing protein [Syntrophotalea acetylenivorans]APG28250.1 histidine kinase [Syntrophotalea acetylenivorans]
MRVGEVCNREVVVIGREATLLEAAKLMRSQHVGNVVVVEEQDGNPIPVGILTDRDMVIALIAEGVPLNAVSVGDVMSFELIIARESDSLFATVEHMRDRGIRRLPVVAENGSLVGILAVDDVLDLLAEQLTALVKLVACERRHEEQRRA